MMIRRIQLLRWMRSVRWLPVALAFVLATVGTVLVGRAASLILIGSGAYDAALPDDVVIVEDMRNVEPGTDVMSRIPISGAPGSIVQAEPTGVSGVDDVTPTITASQKPLVPIDEYGADIITMMPGSGGQADTAQSKPLVQAGRFVTGAVTSIPVGDMPGPVVRAKTASAPGAGTAAPVDAAPQGPVAQPTRVQLPKVSPGPPPARLVPGSPTRIVIPAIAVDSPVVEVGLQTTYSGGNLVSQWATADYAVGFNRTSALPGKPGNTVMSGHNNIAGEVFRNLSNVRAGDTISVFVGHSEFRYIVTEKLLLHENGVSAQQQQLNAPWIAPTADVRLTLVSCWPYSSNTQRLIVIAVPMPNATTAKP